MRLKRKHFFLESIFHFMIEDNYKSTKNSTEKGTNPKIKNVWIFFLTTFVWSWGLWIPRILKEEYDVALSEGFVFFTNMFAFFGPSIIGILFIRLNDPTSGWFKRLLKRFWKPKITRFWWLIIILQPFLFSGMTLLISVYVFNRPFIDQGFFENPLSVFSTFFLIFFLGGPLGEEFGWRGFALEKLHNKWSHGVACIILGLIWTIWHFPLTFFEGTTQSAFPFWQFFVINILVNILYSWIYVNTCGNLTGIMLFHTISNLSASMFPYWTDNIGRYVGFGFMVLTLILIFIWYSPITLKRRYRSGKDPVLHENNQL